MLHMTIFVSLYYIYTEFYSVLLIYVAITMHYRFALPESYIDKNCQLLTNSGKYLISLHILGCV